MISRKNRSNPRRLIRFTAKVAYGVPMAVVLLFAFGSPADAEEQAEMFLEQLRARRFFDIANDYLGYIKVSDLVDENFRNSIPYEEAMNLVGQARSESDVKGERLIREAIAKFKEFANNFPEHPRSYGVRLSVARVYQQLGQAKLFKAKRQGGAQTGLREQARTLYADALKESIEAEELIQKARKTKYELVKPKDKEGIKVRNRLRELWVQSEELQADLFYAMAETYEKGSGKYKQQLTEAVKRFEELFDKHQTRFSGARCRLKQGHALLDLESYEESMICLVDLLEAPSAQNNPHMRKLQLEALRYAMQCWIAEEKYDSAIKMYNIKLKRDELEISEGYDLRYFHAIAEVDKAVSLGVGEEAAKKKLFNSGKKSLKKLVGKDDPKNKWRQPAQDKLISLGEKIASTPKDEKEPVNFNEAFMRAGAAIRERQTLSASLKKGVAEDKQEEVKKQFKEADKQSFKYYKMALAMANDESAEKKLKTCYKAICFLYYDRGDQLEAAVLGDHMSHLYPGSEEAKFGARIALYFWVAEYSRVYKKVAARMDLINKSGGGADSMPDWLNTEFESRNIKKVAAQIVKRWPESDEAITASFRLLMFALQDQDSEQAMLYLKGLPESSPQRTTAEIKIGQLLWNLYARGKSKEVPPEKEVLDRYLADSKKLLTTGLARAAEGELNLTVLTGAYALSQLLVSINQPTEAILLFENQKYGPLTLVEANNPLAIENGYKLKAY
ncbi:MAG: hypothetical protein N2C12_14820, partial [Planctomycetales bacterium]